MITISKSVGRRGRNVPNDVTLVQLLLNANIGKITPLAQLVEDGKSGKKTEGAIEEFQRRVMKMARPNGRVDPGGGTLKELARAVLNSPPANRTAQFENVRLAGRRNQLMTGRITINNRTYYFTCGGHGRGNLPPGRYTVKEHRKSRDGRAYSHDGVGYSFAVSDKHDARVGGADRSLLRIHPDGGSMGTNGCVGILGGRATQNSFRSDMYAELNRSSGSISLLVRKLR